MLLVHAPLAVLTLLTTLELVADQSEAVPAKVLTMALEIATELIELIPKRAFDIQPSENPALANSAQPKGTGEDMTDGNIMENIKEFYFQGQGNLEAGIGPFSGRQIGHLLSRQASKLVVRGFNSSPFDINLEFRSKVLVLLLTKVPMSNEFGMLGVVSSLQARINGPDEIPFQVYSCALSLVTSLSTESQLAIPELYKLIHVLVRRAWTFLGSTALKFHVETARSLWQLQLALPYSNREIEAAICAIMVETDDGFASTNGTTHGQHFTTLWTHVPQDALPPDDRRPSRTSLVVGSEHHNIPASDPYEVMLGRPLFLMLDALVDERCELFLTTRTWLQNLVTADKYAFLLLLLTGISC
jgi:hypothetical protein